MQKGFFEIVNTAANLQPSLYSLDSKQLEKETMYQILEWFLSGMDYHTWACTVKSRVLTRVTN